MPPVRRPYLQMSGGAFISKLLGGIREILMARFFGTGVVTDAYRGSQTLVLSPIHLLTTHLLQTCFIPLYVRGRKEREAEATTLFYLLLAGLVAIGLVLAAALFIWARPITELLLPGFDPARQETATQMINTK